MKWPRKFPILQYQGIYKCDFYASVFLSLQTKMETIVGLRSNRLILIIMTDKIARCGRVNLVLAALILFGQQKQHIDD